MARCARAGAGAIGVMRNVVGCREAGASRVVHEQTQPRFLACLHKAEPSPTLFSLRPVRPYARSHLDVCSIPISCDYHLPSQLPSAALRPPQASQPSIYQTLRPRKSISRKTRAEEKPARDNQMPTPNRRYTYVAFSVLLLIWLWVFLGRPLSLASFLPSAVRIDA